VNPKPENSIAIPSRLPHRVAVLLALIVFPLIWVGGLVTTYDAGMAVPDWPGTYGYNMFAYPLETWLSGPFDLFVEHGHRLLASLAGLIAIALLVVTIRNEPRKFVRSMSGLILFLVIFQGVLGGVRVLLDARVVAKLHGCVGPAFFAVVVAFCVITSRWWWQQGAEPDCTRPTILASGLIRWSGLMLAASFAQLVVGAFLRHISVSSPPHVYRTLVLLHIGMALVLLIGTFAQWSVSCLSRFKRTGIRASINILAMLVIVQIMLGIGTWVVKFGWPVWFSELGFAATFVVGEKTFWQMNLITAHVAVGSLILAFWTNHWLRCRRRFGRNTTNSQKTVSQRPSPLATSKNVTQPLTSS
jgi:cytochrome c oxidase assembly protein subunit 15